MKLSFWDILASMVMLAGLALATIFINIFINPYSFINPFPPPTPIPSLKVPTLTPSLRSLPNVWTPTPKQSETMATVSVSPTLGKGTPSVTVTGTGTQLVLPSATVTRTVTATPTKTKSKTLTPNKTLTTYYGTAYKTNTKTPTLTKTEVASTATNAPCTTVGTNTYCDDNTSSIIYSGTWDLFTASGPYAGTDHYSDTTGASASFTFSGTKITYVYPTYINRGSVQIYIDGVYQTTVNLLSSTLAWQQMWDSGALAAGTHTIAIYGTGGRVDLDAFIINRTGAVITPPTATTGLASSIGATTAEVAGTVNANNNSTTISFEYGPTASYGSIVAASPNTATGSTSVSVNGSLTGLTASTLYHYRVVAVNSGGTSYGSDQTFTTTAAANIPPTDISLSSSSVAENAAGGTVVGTLTTTDPDSSTPYTYSLSTAVGCPGTDNASFSISGDNLETVAPFDYETQASYSICVRTTDSRSGVYNKVLTISVTNVNEAPVITEGASTSVTMDEDGSPVPFALTLNATDPESGTLTWSISGAASHGTATASGSGTSKAIGYTPTGNYNGSDSFIVQVSDGTNSDTITVNVTINTVNDPPVITEGASAAVTMDEDGSPTAFSLTLNATDADGDPITWNINTAAGHGAASASGTSASVAVGYTPTGDYNGSDWFNVQASDGTDSDIISVNVTITAVNDAPTDITLSGTTVPSGSPSGTTVGSLTTTDVDTGDTFTYSFPCTVAGANDASFGFSGSDLLTAAALADGSYAICVHTTDSGAASFDKNFTITVP